MGVINISNSLHIFCTTTFKKIYKMCQTISSKIDPFYDLAHTDIFDNNETKFRQYDILREKKTIPMF